MSGSSESASLMTGEFRGRIVQPPQPCPPPQPPRPPQPCGDDLSLCRDTTDIQARTIRYLLANYEALLRKVEREGTKGPVIINTTQPANPAEGDLWFDGNVLQVYANGEWEVIGPPHDQDHFEIKWELGDLKHFHPNQTIPAGFWRAGDTGATVEHPHEGGAWQAGSFAGEVFFSDGKTRAVSQEQDLAPVIAKIVKANGDDGTTIVV